MNQIFFETKKLITRESSYNEFKNRKKKKFILIKNPICGFLCLASDTEKLDLKGVKDNLLRSENSLYLD